MVNKLKILIAVLLAYMLVTPFVIGVGVLELIVGIIYILRYLVSMCGLALLYTIGYASPYVLSKLPFIDKRLIWSTYRYIARENFRDCLRDIRNMSTLID